MASEVVTPMGRDDMESITANDILRRANRIAAVGRLASGVAHEIRNPLVAIQWNLNLLASKHPEDAETYQLISAELMRIDTTVSQLLSLTKPQVLKFEPIDLQNLLDSIIRLMNAQAYQVNVDIQLVGQSPQSVEGDEKLLTQVFVNLILNALEAMQNGGTLTIALEPEGKEHVAVRFSDTGVGMTEEQLSRLGEPFFTTKSEGTGLGLMICRQIVEEHHGTMEIKSQVGEGTTVSITLRTSS